MILFPYLVSNEYRRFEGLDASACRYQLCTPFRCIIDTCSVLVLVTRWKYKTYLLLLIAAYYIVAGGKSTV